VKKLIRNLPHFKGKFRLVKWLYKKQLASAKDETVAGRFGLQYLLPNLKENIAFEIFSDGVYEPETIEMIVRRLPENAVFLDIGANIGSITMPVCQQRQDIRAVCVEASPKVYKYLESNIGLNNIKNCQLINQLVGEVDNDAVDFFSPDELFGKGSSSPVFTDVPEKVRAVTLDTLLSEMKIPEVHFIKIDIEGYEYFAFKGASKLLNRPQAPDILFEFLDWAEKLSGDAAPGDAQRLLLQFGYQLFKVDKKNRLTKMDTQQETGEAMIFATKKTLS